MDYERVLQSLVGYVNSQTRQTNGLMDELRGEEAELESMNLKSDSTTSRR